MDATRGPILFRCDGTTESGWEPFYQCLSLAAALQRRRRGTHFLSYLDPLSLATVINRGNNDWVPATLLIDQPQEIVREYGVQGTPTTFFIDRQGRITSSNVGPLTHADFQHAITSMW